MFFKKVLLALLLSCTITTLIAQKDTLYFDSSWKQTEKTNAAYFRPLPLKKVGDLFEVKDYYINGKLQMEAFWSNIESEVLHKKAIYYHENGKKSKETHYNHGVLNGTNIMYTEEGLIQSKGKYRDGKEWNGNFYHQTAKLYEYVEGKKIAVKVFYENTVNIAQSRIYKEETEVSRIFFNPEGKKIGEVSIKDYEPETGISILFHKNQHSGVAYVLRSSTYKNFKKEGEEISYTKNGKEIAKGIYKDNQYWSGTFYDSNSNRKSSYKEGKLDGQQIKYEGESIKTIHTYKNGNLDGNTISSFQDKKYTCLFKDGKPFSGEVFEHHTVIAYTNGLKTKKTSYTYGAPSKVAQIQFYENEVLTKQISYAANKEYEMSYKEGKPFSGQNYDDFTGNLTSYKNGTQDGPFFTKHNYPRYTVSGNKKEGKLDGLITFKNLSNNSTKTCTYKDGKPINGTIIYKGKMISSYKNGLLHGLETSFQRDSNYNSYSYDSISRNYIEGRLEGEVSFYRENKLLAKSSYKNNKPFTGVFYKAPKGTSTNVYTYKKGKIISDQYNVLDYNRTLFYKNNKLYQGTYYCKEKLIAEGFFKKDKPFQGNFAQIEQIDENRYPERYTLTSYTDGQKNGNEKVVNFKDKSLERSTIYKDGLKVKETHFFSAIDKDSIVGTFKNGKRFSGDFFYSNNTSGNTKPFYKILSQYKNGKKERYEYFATNGSQMQVLVDSIIYKKGKPFQGNIIEQVEGRSHRNRYENGKLVQKDIHFWDTSGIPDAKIQYNDNGYKVITNTSERSFRKFDSDIIYTNKNATEGNVTVYRENIEIGSFSFSQKGITNAQFSYTDNESHITINSSEFNILDIYIESENELIIFNNTINWEGTLNPMDLILWKIPLFTGNGTANYYLKDKKTQITTCTIKEGQPMNGYIIKINNNQTYSYKEYKNGEPVNTKNDVTETELLASIKRK